MMKYYTRTCLRPRSGIEYPGEAVILDGVEGDQGAVQSARGPPLVGVPVA